MSDTLNAEGLPALSFRAPDVSHPGMRIDELDLNLAGSPLAPFKAARFVVEPGHASPVDSHAVHEIWSVLAGEGELVYDQRPLRLRTGTVWYLEPHKTHQVTNDGTEPLVIWSMWWSV